MTPRSKAALVAGTASVLVAGPLAGASWSHGTMENPVSRVYACYQENPEAPKSAACKAAVAASGTQAFYDWNGVRIGDAAGRHKQLIPDGQLCSGGNPQFKGLDLARADWPSTKLTPGASFTFRFKGTAPHVGTFSLYVTKAGYDASKPLAWSDLEAQPFVSVTNPAMENGAYVLPGAVPSGRTGRHLIYAIWQRSDSPEAFYSCSDIVLGNDSASVPAQPSSQPSAPPSQQPAPQPSQTGLPAKPSQPSLPSAQPSKSKQCVKWNKEAKNKKYKWKWRKHAAKMWKRYCQASKYTHAHHTPAPAPKQVALQPVSDSSSLVGPASAITAVTVGAGALFLLFFIRPRRHRRHG